VKEFTAAACSCHLILSLVRCLLACLLPQTFHQVELVKYAPQSPCHRNRINNSKWNYSSIDIDNLLQKHNFLVAAAAAAW